MTRSALFVTTVDITLEAFLVPLAEHLRRERWRIDALANGASTNPRIDGAFDRRFDVAWSRNPLDPRNLIGTASRVRRIVAEGGYDVVHVHTPIAAFVTRFALRRSRRKTGTAVIYTAHGFHFYEGQSSLPHTVYREMERLAARWTDFLVTINRADYEAARGLETIEPDRVRYIPGIGVDTARYSPGSVSAEEAARVRDELGVPADAFLLAMVAEFSPVKRHAFALDAFARVREPRVILAFVGTGPLQGEIRERVEQLGLCDRVRFGGFRDDIAAVFAASDAALLVSEREGLNRSILEAMASGRPVIGTDTRGIADAVGDEAGWIVGKHDEAALAAAIDEAAADPDALARRGNAARARASTEFALGKVLDLYDGLYREALEAHI